MTAGATKCSSPGSSVKDSVGEHICINVCRLCVCVHVCDLSVVLMQRCEPERFNLLQVAKADVMKSC